MGDDLTIAAAATSSMPASIPIQPIPATINNAAEAKRLEKLRLTAELHNHLQNNVTDYYKRMAEFQAKLEQDRLEYSENVTKKMLAEIEALELESTTNPKLLEQGLNLFSDLFRYRRYNKLNAKAEDMVYNAKRANLQASNKLYAIKQGKETEEGKNYYTNSTNSNNNNLAAFEFQKAGERDFLT